MRAVVVDKPGGPRSFRWWTCRHPHRTRVSCPSTSPSPESGSWTPCSALAPSGWPRHSSPASRSQDESVSSCGRGRVPRRAAGGRPAQRLRSWLAHRRIHRGRGGSHRDGDRRARGSRPGSCGCRVGNGVTAWIALHHLARLQTSDDVVVLGASGGLGGTASRLAAIHPARRVIGVTGSDAKRRFMPAECTDVILGSQPGTALIEITDGRGVDVVINPVGGQLRAGAYKRLAPFGRLIVCRRRIVDRGRFRIAGSDQIDQSRSLSGMSSQEVAEGVRHQLRCGTAGEVHLLAPGHALRAR
jgi:hypothetical protein